MNACAPLSSFGRNGGRRLPVRARTGVCALVSALAFSLSTTTYCLAQETSEFTIRLHDGRIEPPKLLVPADQRLKIVLVNDGNSPAEFESVELRKEKVIGPGVTTFMVIRRLDAGEYVFFDDFHPLSPPAKIIAE